LPFGQSLLILQDTFQFWFSRHLLQRCVLVFLSQCVIRFLAFGFFIESSVDIARPEGASIAGGPTTAPGNLVYR
jgi:hypothetical protein